MKLSYFQACELHCLTNQEIELALTHRMAADAEFNEPEIPPGTPFRRQLSDERHDRWLALYNRPDRLAARQALREQAKADYLARLKAERRAALNTPEACERRLIFAALRKLGFKRESTSGRSAYYSLGKYTVRVSDHEVPMTAAREYALDNGGRSWANSRLSFVIGEDQSWEEWLEDVRAYMEATA